jgi:uncharacterized protein
MTTYVVHRSDQVGSVAQAARDFLESRPVAHNLILTILRDRIARPEPGRYWWITENGVVRGVALQSPLTFRAAVTPVPLDAVGALVDAVAADAPTLPGIGGEAATAAAFAGAWTERFGSAADTLEGQRLYELEAVVEPTGVGGALRVAAPGDVGLVAAWFEAFHAEVETGPAASDLASVAAARVGAGEVWLWERDGEVVSSAMISRAIAGAARIGFVFTPPERRGHGYAAATVARLSATALGESQPFGSVRTCLLYTQLGNATSNRVYRRVGFRSVAEVLVYRFDA